eukprot:jgi/Mesen1/4509/ME000023S03881
MAACQGLTSCLNQALLSRDVPNTFPGQTVQVKASFSNDSNSTSKDDRSFAGAKTVHKKRVQRNLKARRWQPSDGVMIPYAVLAESGEVEVEDASGTDISVPASEEGVELAVSTQILHFGNDFDPYGATSTPLYQTATFKQASATENSKYDYTRSGNPTREALESLLAKVEGAKRAFVFTSGMAALAAITRLLEAGQEVVAGDDIYGGTDRLLSRIVPKSGVTVKRVDTADLDAVRAAVTSKTKLVMMESPTNPRMMISDIRAIAEIAHEHGALLVVDNSIMSPVLSKPLSLGADIVMHSATKFIAGHSDVMAGVLAVRDEELAKEIYFVQNAEGSALAPFDCWLCLRGIKTMPLRVERQQANAQKIAEFLDAHPRITRVNYAGLPSHPGRDLHFQQCKGPGSVFSFATGSLAVSKHVVEHTKLANVTVSFGSVATSISLPCFMSHASIPAEVGIEDVDDIIADFEQALASAPSG